MSPEEHRQQFDDVLARQRGRLLAIARVYAGHEQEDLFQEILLQVWKSLDGFQQRSSVDTWAYRIAINTSLQWRRSNAKKLKLKENLGQYEPIDEGSVDAGTLLDRFFDVLAEPEKALLMMHLDNFSYDQMAEVLGISEGAIRVRMHRLRKRLEQWEGVES